MIHHSYYILGNKDDINQFLTEDKTFTTSLSSAEEFLSEEDAQELINTYKENEKDEYYTGDYLISNQLVIRNVDITIS